MSSIVAIDKAGRPIPKGSTTRPDRYRARYRTPDGASRSKTFDRKVDAERFLTTLEHTKMTGIFVDPSLGRRTFGDYACGWLATKADVRPRTRINLEGRLRNHILPVFGDVPIARVRPEHVRAFVASLSEHKGLAPATVKAAYLALAGAGDSRD